MKKILDQDSEYNSILKQAISIIDKTRENLAESMNLAISSVHWNIGKLLYERKVSSDYGDGIVKRLSIDLKQYYPQMGVSIRNLWNMKKFYERFCNSDLKLQHCSTF